MEQNTENPGFACVVDASGDGGQIGDACEYLNACDPGLACLQGAIPDCQGPGCCSPWCDTTQPNNCPFAPEQVCHPWHENDPWPGFETLGTCTLPP